MARRKSKSKRRLALIALILALLILAGVCIYFFAVKGYTMDEFFALFAPQEKPSETVPTPGTIETDDLSIHFMELGNKYAGDSTLIKIGDTEVLIDAGSRKGSAETLVPYIKQYCTDGVLEYVVATHADQDHIAAFIGTSSAPGIFDSFACETIIDFPRTDKDTATVKDYYEKRDAEVEAGAVHYSALECWKGENGAKRTYQLANDVTMEILYNYYYEHSSPDENNYSVCLLITQGDYHYLFTGDLEEEGESYLVEYNELPQCKLFKGGHHGSKTSSTSELLEAIQPKYVAVCCCAGYNQYGAAEENVFPTQAFCDRIAPYTDKVYVTIMWDEAADSYKSMNGDIVFYYGKSENETEKSLKLWCSENSTVLKDTEWFKQNRTWNGA